MTEVPRRRCETWPDQALLLNGDPFANRRSYAAFVEASGIAPELLLTSDVVSIPVPLWQPDWAERGLKRWDGVRADFMWHPLMWLPERLRAPYRVIDADGTTRPEPVDVYLARIAIEMSSSGIYDRETGSWLDLLAINGIDLSDKGDLQRVEDWLAGTPDTVLDTISTDEFFAAETDPDWSAKVALDLEPDLSGAEWALESQHALDVIDAMLATDGLSPDELIDALARTCDLMSVSLFGAQVSEPGLDVAEALEAIATEASQGVPAATIAASAQAVLSVVRDDNWHHVERLFGPLPEPSPQPERATHEPDAVVGEPEGFTPWGQRG